MNAFRWAIVEFLAPAGHRTWCMSTSGCSPIAKVAHHGTHDLQHGDWQRSRHPALCGPGLPQQQWQERNSCFIWLWDDSIRPPSLLQLISDPTFRRKGQAWAIKEAKCYDTTTCSPTICRCFFMHASLASPASCRPTNPATRHSALTIILTIQMLT